MFEELALLMVGSGVPSCCHSKTCHHMAAVCPSLHGGAQLHRGFLEQGSYAELPASMIYAYLGLKRPLCSKLSELFVSTRVQFRFPFYCQGTCWKQV